MSEEISAISARFVLCAVFVSVFGLAAWSKFSGGMPAWFVTQFHETLLSRGPGGPLASLAVSFYFIAVLEAATTLTFFASLARREFLQNRSRIFLRSGLILAMATFAVLGFGLRLTGDFNGAFQLFAYFALTFVLTRCCGDGPDSSVSPPGTLRSVSRV